MMLHIQAGKPVTSATGSKNIAIKPATQNKFNSTPTQEPAHSPRIRVHNTNKYANSKTTTSQKKEGRQRDTGRTISFEEKPIIKV